MVVTFGDIQRTQACSEQCNSATSVHHPEATVWKLNHRLINVHRCEVPNRRALTS
jgi:hypothetical protein